jgi:predicted nucleotide-binding protein (sugar kinase/HSP70/actin superfamily)
MGLRIGIPRALWYYTHFPFWRTFLESLGAQVVLSSPTSRDILNAGVEETVSEACVPIKVYLGHVWALVNKWERQEIDALFLPRYVSWCNHTVYCPKFLGLPDIVRSSFTTLPPLVEVRIDRRRPFALLAACNQIRCQLGAPFSALFRAYHQAMESQRLHEQRQLAGWDPLDSIAGRQRIRSEHANADTDTEKPIRLALLGYPYLVYDRYVNLGLLDKLRAIGVQVFTTESVPLRYLNQQKQLFTKRLFWTYSDLVARAGYYFLNNGQPLVDGIIHVTAFGCGPDAMVDKLLELAARRYKLPFLPVTLDEHTGAAGITTRLEAFVDMLDRRRRAIC